MKPRLIHAVINSMNNPLLIIIFANFIVIFIAVTFFKKNIKNNLKTLANLAQIFSFIGISFYIFSCWGNFAGYIHNLEFEKLFPLALYLFIIILLQVSKNKLSSCKNSE